MTDILMSPIRLHELEALILKCVRAVLEEGSESSAPKQNPDRKLSINQLREYLPEKPARQTIYGWVSARRVPFQKHGSKLFFIQSEIDAWLENSRQMSHLKEVK